MTTKLLEEILSKENLEKACTAVVRNKVESTYSDVHMGTVEDYTKKKKSTDETRSTKMASQGTIELTQRMHGNRQRWTKVNHQ